LQNQPIDIFQVLLRLTGVCVLLRRYNFVWLRNHDCIFVIDLEDRIVV